MKNSVFDRGFSLVELLIVVAIIAILAVIAYPSYSQYKIKTNRAEMQTEMMSIAQRLQSYYVANHNYTTVTLGGLGFSTEYPTDGNPMYQLSLVAASQTWELQATPKTETIQKDDGVILLNEKGQKCWVQGATTCTLSATSSWS